MPTIKNKLRQRVSFELEKGKTLTLLAKGKSDVSDTDVGSPMLKRAIAKGEVVILGVSEKKSETVTEKKIKGKS